MASLSKDSRGSWYIQYQDRNRQRRTLRLGRINKRSAQTIAIRVRELVSANLAGTAPDNATSIWLSEIGDQLSDKLAALGLIGQRNSTTLGAYIADYIEKRTDVADSTKRKWRKTHSSLLEYFGERKPIQTITRGDAAQWRRTVKASGRAENTIRSWVKIAKSLFNNAVSHQLIDTNPFEGLESTLVKNAKREHFITHDDAQKVLAACPGTEWKLIFALARYGGLRVPSEVLALRWSDILWDRDRFVVRCVKTSHLPGHEERIVPLFPELAPYLEKAFEEAPEGATYVIQNRRNPSGNYRTTMRKIITRAGIEIWPRLFQNLRSSRETELADRFPIKAVCDWIGNSEAVAKGHYLQTTEEHFSRAISPEKSAAYALQSTAVLGGTEGK